MKIINYIGLIIFISFFTFSCQKITENKLIGNWEILEARIQNIDEYLSVFEDKYQASEDELIREKQRVEALPEAYYPIGIIFIFKDNGIFELGGIPGKWNLNTDNQELIISLASFDETKFIVKKLTKNELVLVYTFSFADIDLKAELMLKRVKAQ